MKNAKVGVKVMWGLAKVDLQREANEIPLGGVRYFERKINGENFLIIIINREAGLKIMAMGDDGVVTEIFKEEPDGQQLHHQ